MSYPSFPQQGFNSFARALSPAAIGVANAASGADPSGNTEFSRRLAALGMARTHDEIMLTIPGRYREALRPHLEALARHADLGYGTKVALGRLQLHKAKKTLPSQLAGLKAPLFQVHAEFKDSNPPLIAELTKLHDQYRLDALDMAIALRQAELNHFDDLVAPLNYLPALATCVEATYASIKDTYRRPVFGKNANGEVTVETFEEDPIYKMEFQRLESDLSQYAYRILSLVYDKLSVEEAKLKAKETLKDRMDVEVGDEVINATAIKDQVDRSIQSALARLGATQSAHPPSRVGVAEEDRRQEPPELNLVAALAAGHRFKFKLARYVVSPRLSAEADSGDVVVEPIVVVAEAKLVVRRGGDDCRPVLTFENFYNVYRGF
ncbi:hypothetical protein JAAARDRAFT_49280 [Jaapia argillacea MUCL 33604]|uniref:Uncharacterized protein n=1 Tax=Jaapia argillacea MUCL 33604 TaxID=933084 RepID=A0A067PH20_9AGAM|nr:hypothetical protein JAAARDRAFT_49280 [Jaapia argillacea MUCL 33604]